MYGRITDKHNTFEKPYHMLHADTDFSITVEGPVEAHNIGGVTLM